MIELFLPQENFDRPAGGRLYHFIFGAVIPGAITWFFLSCIERRSTPIPHRRGIDYMSGDAAVSLAVAYIAIAAFMHFHYVWGGTQRISRYSQPGKSLSFLVFLGALLYAFFRYFTQ